MRNDRDPTTVEAYLPEMLCCRRHPGDLQQFGPSGRMMSSVQRYAWSKFLFLLWIGLEWSWWPILHTIAAGFWHRYRTFPRRFRLSIRLEGPRIEWVLQSHRANYIGKLISIGSERDVRLLFHISEILTCFYMKAKLCKDLQHGCAMNSLSDVSRNFSEPWRHGSLGRLCQSWRTGVSREGLTK